MDLSAPKPANRKSYRRGFFHLPVQDWLALLGKGKHLLEPKYGDVLAAFQSEVDRRWNRLKARAEHPLL